MASAVSSTLNGALDQSLYASQSSSSAPSSYQRKENGNNTTAPPASFNYQPRNYMNAEQDMMKRQLEELQRTITFVYWYKPNAEPIRLPHAVPTFPLFQLSSSAPTLINDLNLGKPGLYLDTWNAASSKWEQHTVESVRLVESGQRLLYRFRKTLLEGMRDDECVGLQEELRAAGSATSSNVQHPGLKRHAEDDLQRQALRARSPARQTPPTRSENTTTPKMTTISPPPKYASPMSLQHTPTPSSYAGPSHHPTPSTSTSTSAPISYPPIQHVGPSTPTQFQDIQHPPPKRWPNDYTVAEVSRGFLEMEALCQPTVPGVPPGSDTEETRKAMPANMTQKAAFEKVFGHRYVKSTLCRHRGAWRKAPEELRKEFEKLPDNDQRGVWGEFVRRIEGRPPGKNSIRFVTES